MSGLAERLEKIINWRNTDLGVLLGLLLIVSQLTIFWIGNSSRIPITIAIVIGFVWFFFRGKSFRGIYPVLALVMVICCAFMTWVSVNIAPGSTSTSSLRLDVLAKLFSFIPIGWVLYKKEEFIFPFLVATIIGACITPFSSGDTFNQFVDFLKQLISDQGELIRYDFGFHSVDFSGMIFGFDVLLLVFLRRRFIYRNETFSYPGLFLYLLLLVFSVMGVLVSQARASLLGLLVVSIVFSVTSVYRVLKTKQYSNVTMLAPVVILMVMSILFVNIWQKRAVGEEETISTISDLNFKDIPMTSIGLRLHLINLAIPALMERPLFGWGNEGSEIIIDRSGWSEDAIKQTGNFHNVILDIWVRHGLIVLVIIMSVYSWFLYESRRAYRNGIMPTDFHSFLVAYVIYFSVANLFDAYLLYGVGDIVNHSALSVALVYIFRNRHAELSRR